MTCASHLNIILPHFDLCLLHSVSSTLSAFVTVVYNDSNGQVPDLLNLGTTLSPTWTLVDKQSSEGVNKSVSCHFRQTIFSIQSSMKYDQVV